MKLEVKKLSKTFGKKRVLKGIDLTWQPGEIVGLVGRNGAGKSTLMRALVGQYPGVDATIAIDGNPFFKDASLRSQLIYVDATQDFFGKLSLSALGEYYAAGYEDFNENEYKRLLNDYRLKQNDRYNELSKGYRALVVIALTFASNVPLMLLDEPFDGLDVLVREKIVRAVISAVAKGNRGALIASHNLEELDGIVDRVLFLKDGVISQAADLEDVREHTAKLQLVFRDPEVPTIVRELGRVIDIKGRVITALFDEYDAALEDKLRAANPVLLERLPLSLTDLFKGEYVEGGNVDEAE